MMSRFENIRHVSTVFKFKMFHAMQEYSIIFPSIDSFTHTI